MKNAKWTTVVGSTLILLIGILVYRGFGQLVPHLEDRAGVVSESGMPGHVFWQTSWFQWGIAAVCVGMLYAYFYWSARRHEAQKRRLAALIKERTQQLQQAKEDALDAQRAAEAAQQAAEVAQRAAEVANQAKSIFLANMSHELRTPLNVILGFTQLMARNSDIPAEEHEHLNTIQRSGEYLLTLINQVLDLSKIEARRVTLNETTFDLYRLLAEVEAMFSLKAKRHQLQLLVEHTDDVPHYIRTDEVKLRQVLINLLTNALKFTREGGVAVRVKRVAGPDNSLTHTLVFEIEDTGPGIASEELDDLFEAFTQTKAGQQAYEGTGLGLPISRKFVQLMGGDIRVTSQIGRGTLFTFDCVAGTCDGDNVQEISQVRKVKSLEPGQPLYRILVVDDVADNRRLLVELLSPLGFDVSTAVNGREAIDAWSGWHPHLIWMDLRMAGMAGYEATQRIRTLETESLPADTGESPSDSDSQSRTVIIALSASSFEDERSVALSKGCDEFLRKPFRNSEIFDLMQNHLGVQYVYDAVDENPAPARSSAQQTLEPAELRALPADIQTTLRQAVDAIDVATARQIVDRIRQQNVPLADMLDDLVSGYRFDILQSVCEELHD